MDPADKKHDPVCMLSALALVIVVFTGCHSEPNQIVSDEIVIAGQSYHTGTHVITWHAPNGYNAYQDAKKLKPRKAALSFGERERLQTFGWDLNMLQKYVDQFILHYDGHGLSKNCFSALHKRGLNVHFMLDIDGTVYQTLDLQERALHATTSNDRSIGIEIANLGAYSDCDTNEFDEWYHNDPQGQVFIQPPTRVGPPMIHTTPFIARPSRPGTVRGSIQDHELVQYDFTPEQYAALIKLTATLCRIFPLIKSDYPRDANGLLVPRKLPDHELDQYRGILGHYHIQTNKNDPGPAFQWEKFICGVRQLLMKPLVEEAGSSTR